jgi:hypothetical protein
LSSGIVSRAARFELNYGKETKRRGRNKGREERINWVEGTNEWKKKREE